MIGKVFNGRYEIKEKIGAGGTSVVYMGLDMLLGRSVTIKILREEFGDDSEFVRRFQHEAQAVAGLAHGNIVSIYDVGYQDGMHYIVMEFVEGETLKDYIGRNGPLSIEEAVSVMFQVLDGIHYAHEHGIIHRDIKAQNILFSKDRRVKVTDFGIALGLNEMTQTYNNASRIMGSVHYISPEQVQGLNIDERTDVYAAGVVMYEMLTGRLPFTGDTPISVAMKHVREEVIPPHQHNPLIPLGLSYVILRALRKAPDMRHNSAKDMAINIYEVLEGQGGLSLNDSQESTGTQTIRDLQEKTTPRNRDVNSGRRRRKKVRWGLLVKTLLILTIICLIGVGVFWGYEMLKNMFDNETDVEVPDVVGKNIEIAKTMLEARELVYSVTLRNNSEIEKDTVISQGYPAGQVVGKNRVIELVVSLGPTQIKVPPVIGLTRREAEISLTNNAFGYVYAEAQFDDEVAVDRVISVTPDVGTLMDEHSTVTIVLSRGMVPVPITMPRVIGLTLAEAEQLLDNNRLLLGGTSAEASGEYAAGIVIAQIPGENTTTVQGSEVSLVISSGPGPGAVSTVPEVVGTVPGTTTPSSVPTTPDGPVLSTKLVDTDNYMIPSDGARHRVRVEVVDALGTRSEYDSEVDSGTTFVYHDILVTGVGTVTIYVDENMVWTERVE